MRPRNWRGVSITRWPGCSRSETPVGGGVVPPCRGIGPATLRNAAVASRNAPCSATLRSSTPYLPTCVTTCRPCAATGNGSCQRPTLTSGPPPSHPPEDEITGLRRLIRRTQEGWVGAEVTAPQPAEPERAGLTASRDVGRFRCTCRTGPRPHRPASGHAHGPAGPSRPSRSGCHAGRTGTARSRGPQDSGPGLIRQLSPVATSPGARSARARVSIHRPS